MSKNIRLSQHFLIANRRTYIFPSYKWFILDIQTPLWYMKFGVMQMKTIKIILP